MADNAVTSTRAVAAQQARMATEADEAGDTARGSWWRTESIQSTRDAAAMAARSQ